MAAAYCLRDEKQLRQPCGTPRVAADLVVAARAKLLECLTANRSQPWRTRADAAAMFDDRALETPATALLYKRLLAFGANPDPDRALLEIATLLVEVTTSDVAIIELRDPSRADSALQITSSRAGLHNGDAAHALAGTAISATIGTSDRGTVAAYRAGASAFAAIDRERIELVAAALTAHVKRLLERRRLLDTLASHAGNIRRTARELGIARSKIYRDLAAFGIKRQFRRTGMSH